MPEELGQLWAAHSEDPKWQVVFHSAWYADELPEHVKREVLGGMDAKPVKPTAKRSPQKRKVGTLPMTPERAGQKSTEGKNLNPAKDGDELTPDKASAAPQRVQQSRAADFVQPHKPGSVLKGPPGKKQKVAGDPKQEEGSDEDLLAVGEESDPEDR